MKTSVQQSRNSWINKDEPTDVSTMAHYKDGYEDIMEDRRHSSDLKYAARARQDVPMYKYCHVRTPEQIKWDVLKTQRVAYALEKTVEECGVTMKEAQQEALEIAEEMAHRMSMGWARSFCLVVVKVFKALFNRLYVNEEGIQQMRKLIQEYPVLLMPTHRSYMDFLLVSYVFYHYDLPLPVIAAAMDFKGMKFVGYLLSKCGAFYIRRSFGTDRLYWAIFTEYVQTHMRNGDAPIEFFVEGTRSRTAKSYVPRIGMLSAALESYFKAEIPDAMVVPITISYDRILEESLYAYELLGIPKPKESTAGLFKARSVLQEDYGSVHMHIGDPISIRQFSNGKINRCVHALEPRYINNLTSEEAKLTRQLAFHIVHKQLQHMVITPWALMAAVLMQSREGISVRQLVKEVDWLKKLAGNLSAYIDWPGNAQSETVVRHYLSLHTNVVSVSQDDLVTLQIVKPAHVSKPLQDQIMLNAATNLILASYRNQLLHIFVHVGLVALSVNGCVQDTMTIDTLFERYCFLEKLLCMEFIFQLDTSKQDFEQAVLNLTHSGGLTVIDGLVHVKKSINKHTTFLSQMFEPFLQGYWVLCQHLLSLAGDVHGRPLAKKPKDIAKDAQLLGIRLIQESLIKHYEVISLDLLSNGLAAMVEMGCLYKDRRNEQPWLSPNNVMVSKLAEDIGKYVELPPVAIAALLRRSKTVVMSAKL